MECKYPIIVKNPNFKKHTKAMQYLRVPCNKCSECLSRRSRQWIFRIQQELKDSLSAWFCTFTYEDEYLVYSNTGIPTLCKSDMQRYWKRLRKAQSKSSKKSIRYFMCGEYGFKGQRPHYHAIIFNADRDLIESKWELGIVHIGTVTQDSIAYNTKYIMKVGTEWYKELVDKKSENYDESFQREYSSQSKGIGKRYSESKEVRRYHKSDLSQNYIVTEGGYRVPIPRYYKDKIFTEEERSVLRKHATTEISKADMEKFKKFLELEKQGKDPWKDQIDRTLYHDYIVYKRLNQKNQKL